MSRVEGGRSTGARVVRVLLIAAALVAAVVLLFTIVFPWFDRNFVSDPVLDVRGTAAAEADAGS